MSTQRLTLKMELPPEGRVIRLRGQLDADARRIGVDRMTDRGWMELIRAFAGTGQ